MGPRPSDPTPDVSLDPEAIIAHELEAEDFLDLIYGTRPSWIDLPSKVGPYWVPFHLEWPSDATVSRRIDSCLRDSENLYYSVGQFAKRGRNIEDVLPLRWLWADLDEVHPSAAADFGGLLPTIAIETSPGRYQALWKLTKLVPPVVAEKVNQGLSYALDADKSGWDLTQVLRLPGTRNFKYPGGPAIRVLWYADDVEYDIREVWRAVRGAVPQMEWEANGLSGSGAGGAGAGIVPRRPISSRAKRLLGASVAEVVEGERSARLWELECLLAEAGLEAEEIYALVWPCAWNKWRGVASGDRRLRGDIRKAMAHVKRTAAAAGPSIGGPKGSVLKDQGVDQDADEEAGEETGEAKPDEAQERLPFIGYSSFMAMEMEDPKWLIEDIWTAGSHGIIGGEPKTNKTTIALAMGLSIASGKPFLGQYVVGVQGPVLMVQEENAPWMMQDRLRKIAAYYGLISTAETHTTVAEPGALGKMSLELDFPTDVPLKLLNNYGFDLAVEEHREMLEAEIDETRPVLLILDPLYLILGGADQNQVNTLVPFLKWLLQVRNEYGCAIAVLHHFRKQSNNGVAVRAGQRLMGNAILHGWVDSALYMEKLDDVRPGWVKVGLEKEFRSMAPQSSSALSISMGDPGSLEMTVEIEGHGVEQVIMDIVLNEPGVTVRQVAETTGMDKRTVLARVRGGSGGIEVVSGKKGRGHSHRLFPAGTTNGSAAGSKA
jgi:hypothetical protein